MADQTEEQKPEEEVSKEEAQDEKMPEESAPDGEAEGDDQQEAAPDGETKDGGEENGGEGDGEAAEEENGDQPMEDDAQEDRPADEDAAGEEQEQQEQAEDNAGEEQAENPDGQDGQEEEEQPEEAQQDQEDAEMGDDAEGKGDDAGVKDDEAGDVMEDDALNDEEADAADYWRAEDEEDQVHHETQQQNLGEKEDQEGEGGVEGGEKVAEEETKDSKEEKKEDVECEEDSKDDDRPRLDAKKLAVSGSDTTLNVMTTGGGKLLTCLSDSGFQHLVAGARLNYGVTGGRYLFEVRVVELKHLAESGGRQRVPRHSCALGFSTAGSSLFLGSEATSVGFDTEGYSFKDGKSTWLHNRQHLAPGVVLAVLLNLDQESPNANTVSLFADGIRVSKPLAIPDELKGKALIPTVNYKNLAVHVNFGTIPFANLPFSCRTLQDAAVEDVEAVPASKESEKKEVLFPVGLPDEGTFDWLDEYLKENPQYTELSARAILKWGERSGLWRQGSGRRTSNDQPAMEFGIKELDDLHARNLMKSVAPVLNRNYVLMEVQKNLLAEERKKALASFDPSDFKRVALVVMGEPPEDYKARMRDLMLEDKKNKARNEISKPKKKHWEDRGKAGSVHVHVTVEADKEDNKSKADKDTEKEEEEMKKKLEKIEEMTLTEQEKQLWFRKPVIEDMPRRDLSNSFSSFSIPSQDEGFDEIRYIWQGESACAEYLQGWLKERKLTQRVDDLQPGAWFKEQHQAWQKASHDWNRRLDDWKDSQDPRKKRRRDEDPKDRGSKGADNEEKGGDDAKNGTGDDSKDTAKASLSQEDVDVWRIEDVNDIGNGEPLFSKFTFEDWMLTSLRYELHLLAHAYRHDINDPERISFHENHIPFYYETYYKKSLNLKNYGVSSVLELLEMVKDTLEVFPKNSVLDPQLSEDTPMENFVKLTEDQRRQRILRTDAGDETAALKFERERRSTAGARGAPYRGADNTRGHPQGGQRKDYTTQGGGYRQQQQQYGGSSARDTGKWQSGGARSGSGGGGGYGRGNDTRGSDNRGGDNRGRDYRPGDDRGGQSRGPPPPRGATSYGSGGGQKRPYQQSSSGGTGGSSGNYQSSNKSQRTSYTGSTDRYSSDNRQGASQGRGKSGGPAGRSSYSQSQGGSGGGSYKGGGRPASGGSGSKGGGYNRR